MKCTFCEAENAEGAVFCSSCGKRIDGKKNCPACGALNPEAASFCSSCGASMKAAPAPKPAPAPAAQNVTPPPAYSAPATVSDGAAEAPADNALGKKVVTLTGAICAAVAVVFSLIFFFLIGVDAKVSAMGESEILGSYGIGYWLGTIWDNPDSLTNPGVIQYFELLESSGDYILPTVALMMNGTYGLLTFVVIGIILVVVGIKAIIAFVKYFTKKPGKDITKLAIGVYFLYALTATIIKSLMAMETKVSGGGESAFQGTVYNGATMAGLVIGGLMIGIMIVSRIAVQGKALLKKNVLIPGIISICAVVFSAVTWALLSGALFGQSANEMGMSGSMLYGFMAFGQTVAQGKSIEDIIVPVMLATYVQMFVGIAIIMASRLTVKHISGLATGKTEKDLRFAIVTLIFTVIAFSSSLAILTEDVLMNIGWDTEALTTGPIITALVMSIISLGLTIASIVVRGKMAPKPEPIAPVYQA